MACRIVLQIEKKKERKIVVDIFCPSFTPIPQN